jgi:hypothetical protein
MKNRLAFGVIALFFMAVWLPLYGRQSLTFKEDVFVGKDEVQDNVIAFGGNVTVEGKVKENVVAFGGSITVSGEVGDSVVGIGSMITLRSTALVKGDVVSMGGALNKEPGCVIQRDTVYFKSSELFPKLFKGGLFSFPFGPIILVLKLISMFIWLLLALVIAAVFTKQVFLASSQIRGAFWPVVGTGLIALILFAGLVITFALLSFILIGIPFLLFLIAVGTIIKIFGTVVLFYFFGESLGKAFGSKSVAPMAAVVLGLIVISFIKFIPILGFLFSFFLSIIAWGVVIRTKFGTTENWLKRKG